MLPSFPTEAEARHEEGFLNSADHLRLYWQRYTPPSPKATVLVLHGGGDHCGRYPGITAALVQAGFEAALFDFRGHAQSDGRRWHVEYLGPELDRDLVGEIELGIRLVCRRIDVRRELHLGAAPDTFHDRIAFGRVHREFVQVLPAQPPAVLRRVARGELLRGDTALQAHGKSVRDLDDVDPLH